MRPWIFGRLIVGIVAIVLLTAQRGTAQEAVSEPSTEPPLLYRTAPHDLLLLKSNPKLSLQTQLLDLPGRHLPVNPAPNERLSVRLLDKPGEIFEVEWRHVAEIQLYEPRVLAQAERLVKAGQFDEAFEAFEFLQTFSPQLTGLAAAVTRSLHLQARYEMKQRRWRAALSLLYDLTNRPEPPLEAIDELVEVSSQLIDAALRERRAATARQFVASLIARAPQHRAITQLRQQFQTAAQQHLTAAQAALAQHRSNDARRELESALALAPDLQQAAPLLAQLNALGNSISVGVRTPPRWQSVASASARLVDPTVRRDQRLLARALLDIAAVGPDGGRYEPLLGQLTPRADGGVSWHLPSDGEFTGFDLARHLHLIADPRRLPRPLLATALDRVTVSNVFQVDAYFRTPPLLTEALLAQACHDAASAPAGKILAGLHPYTATRVGPLHVRYRLNEPRGASDSAAPYEVNSVFFDDDAAAIDALKRGAIDVLDDVPPDLIGRCQSHADCVVAPYRLPTLHMLLLNRRHPWLQVRSFRRGLSYALDRQTMLAHLVLGGQKLPGAELLAGPFPRGFDVNDPLGYAVDPLIKPRAYDPELATTLLALAQSPAPRSENSAPTAPPPDAAGVPAPLVFKYPATSMARRVARAVARQWTELGAAVELVELPPGDFGQSDPGDVLYVELVMAEPLVEARLLLGPGALAGGSPYVAQALDELDRVTDWGSARQKLRQIHRLAVDDVALIPLWQLRSHYAHSRQLSGLGKQPIALFQQLSAWQLAPQAILAKDPLWPEGTPPP